MKKLIIIILTTFILLINNVDAANMYSYVCDDIKCYNTDKKILDDYYLINKNITKVNDFNVYLNNNLDYFKNYYDNSTFIIKNFCSWNCNNLFNANITLTELLNRKTEFHIWKTTLLWLWSNEIVDTYSSWLDYLFSNFGDIINQLHIGFPIWDKKSNLEDIFKNILSYNTISDNLVLRNVCDNSSCKPSSKKNISIYNKSWYYFLSWTIKNSTSFKNDTFKVSDNYNISDLFLKAWESLNFNFGFEDYLDTSSTNTQYEYRIYYNYDWEWIPSENNYFLKETIDIKNSNYKVTSPNISDALIPNIVKIDVIDNDVKKIRVWISEWIKLTKSWKINFYLSAKNVNTWDKFDIKLVNSVPVSVLPNDNVTIWTSQITSTFSEDLNSFWKWFNIWDTFSVLINLKDEFNNEHYDFISWYDISLSTWSSDFIELSKYWTNIYSKTLVWVETISNDLPYSIIFKFKITAPWYHILNWFDIKVRSKENDNIYEVPAKYKLLENIIPVNLYDSLNQKMKIYIKEPTYSDLPVSCWPVVKVNYTCTSDNFSWCNDILNTTKSYIQESDNWTSWFVTISDHAYNVKNYSYTINHVDKTAPEISLYKWWFNLLDNSYSYKANSDKLSINFYEWTTTSCITEVNYIIKVNWVEITSWVENISDPKVELNDFFKIAWNKILNIKTIDKYWNINEKTINFTIYPNLIDQTKSSIYLIYNTKNSIYADFSSIYTYKLTLKDEFWNNIFWKNLTYLNNECLSPDWCRKINQNMTNNSWGDWLIESNYNWITNSLWEVNFNVKSYAPWLFSEIFHIKYNDWDNNYNNLSSEKVAYIWNNNSYNSFKKPFTWELLVSSNSWTTYDAIPEVWTNQKYKIKLFSNSDLTYTNWKINIIKNVTIKNWIQWHLFENFLNIVNDFWNNLNNYLWFTARINVDDNVLISPDIKWNDLEISYNLNWKNIKYYLTKYDNWDDNTKLELFWENKTTLWIKVVWNLKWAWKYDLTWQEKNFTDISLFDSRSKIRKEAYLLIKWMSNWQILKWIKYVDWEDIKISWDNLWYETLIVKNWNVIIEWNLNTIWQKLWIIVLKDWYSVNSDYDKSWNIYINSWVKYINWIFYADWWLISSNNNWNPYLVDNIWRTSDLKYQLVFKWSLFTRNTIGWSVLAGGYYLLPWWEKTFDFDKSMIYDLNYLRTGIIWWDWADSLNDWNQYNLWFDDPFVIIYNPLIQTNPPKWF